MTDQPETVSSFDSLYDQEYERQVRRAYLMTGSAADAHDIVHDCLAAMHERWSRIDNPAGYLNRSVTNGCRRFGRRSGMRRLAPLTLPEHNPATSSAFDGVDMRQLLLSLPFKQRGVVVLRYYAGLTEAEIAHALDMPAGSVGPTIHRALTRLRKVLQ